LFLVLNSTEHGSGQDEAFGRDAFGQAVKYFAQCFAPTAIAAVMNDRFLRN
jgi:hypothetical protein